MEILAYPHRSLWPVLAQRLNEVADKPRIGKEHIDSLMRAFMALYQVQWRLWVLPDKAMSARGVSLTVSRTPVRAATLVIDPGMSLPAAASMVCAVSAVGVEDVTYMSSGPVDEELAYILKNIPRSDRSAPCMVSFSSQKGVRGCSIVVVADFTSDAEDVARDVATALSLGFRVAVVTDNPAIASSLPVAVSPEDSRRLTIIVEYNPEQVNDLVEALHPGLIVDERESARQNASGYFRAGNVLIGPLPEVDGAEALLMLTAPIIPIHTLTDTLLVVDPLLAR